MTDPTPRAVDKCDLWKKRFRNHILDHNKRVLYLTSGRSRTMNPHNLEHPWYGHHDVFCHDFASGLREIVCSNQVKIIVDEWAWDQPAEREQLPNRPGHRVQKSDATSYEKYVHFVPDFALMYVPHEIDTVTRKLAILQGRSYPIIFESKRAPSRTLAQRSLEYQTVVLQQMETAWSDLYYAAKGIFMAYKYQTHVVCVALVGDSWSFVIVTPDDDRLPRDIFEYDGDREAPANDEDDAAADIKPTPVSLPRQRQREVEVECADPDDDNPDDGNGSDNLGGSHGGNGSGSDSSDDPINSLPRPEHETPEAGYSSYDEIRREFTRAYRKCSLRIWVMGQPASNQMVSMLREYLKSKDGEEWVNYED